MSCLQFGDMRGFWGVWHAGLSQLRKKTGVISTAEGEGTANTALVYHANKLMSLHEGDLPYAVSCPKVFMHWQTILPFGAPGPLMMNSVQASPVIKRQNAVSVHLCNMPMRCAEILPVAAHQPTWGA